MKSGCSKDVIRYFLAFSYFLQATHSARHDVKRTFTPALTATRKRSDDILIVAISHEKSPLFRRDLLIRYELREGVYQQIFGHALSRRDGTVEATSSNTRIHCNISAHQPLRDLSSIRRTSIYHERIKPS